MRSGLVLGPMHGRRRGPPSISWCGRTAALIPGPTSPLTAGDATSGGIGAQTDRRRPSSTVRSCRPGCPGTDGMAHGSSRVQRVQVRGQVSDTIATARTVNSSGPGWWGSARLGDRSDRWTCPEVAGAEVSVQRSCSTVSLHGGAGRLAIGCPAAPSPSQPKHPRA